jgi:hypothetical protein
MPKLSGVALIGIAMLTCVAASANATPYPAWAALLDQPLPIQGLGSVEVDLCDAPNVMHRSHRQSSESNKSPIRPNASGPARVAALSIIVGAKMPQV